MRRFKKYTKEIISCLLMMTFFMGCSDDEFPTFSPPLWQVNYAEYSVSMTAIIQLPDNLIQYADENDQLAAFAGNVCRGIGEVIDGLWYVTIHGTPEDQSIIHLQYYSARNKYLYESPEISSFEDNKAIGSVDEPETISLTIVKK